MNRHLKKTVEYVVLPQDTPVRLHIKKKLIADEMTMIQNWARENADKASKTIEEFDYANKFIGKSNREKKYGIYFAILGLVEKIIGSW